MEIFTIAYNKDLDLLKLQIKSFSTFLYPKEKNINIIINEKNKDAKNDEDELRKLAVPFKLNFLYQDDILPSDASSWGWISQQVCKLLAPTASDYIVFDCKDILINPVHIDEITPEIKPNIRKTPGYDGYMEFYNDVSDLLGETFKVYPHITTPKIIKIDVRDKIFNLLNQRQGVSDFFKKYKMPSEFILHDLVKMHIGGEFQYSHRAIKMYALWDEAHLESLDLEKVFKTSKIIKVHHRLSKSPKYNKLYRRLFKRADKESNIK